MDRGAWRAIVHGIEESRTRLKLLKAQRVVNFKQADVTHGACTAQRACEGAPHLIQQPHLQSTWCFSASWKGSFF